MKAVLSDLIALSDHIVIHLIQSVFKYFIYSCDDFNYIYMCICVYVQVSIGMHRLEDNLEARVAGCCEPPPIRAKTQT